MLGSAKDPVSDSSTREWRSLKSALTTESVKDTLEKTFQEFNHIGESYRRGFLNDSDFLYGMEQALYRGFWSFLSANGIELRINEANYPSFAKEYRACFDGVDEEGHSQHSWFCDRRDPTGEASANDSRMIFNLMGKYHMGPDYFEPIPEDIPRYSLHGIHQYHSAGVCGTDFNCVDDGGLLSDDRPVGKTFRLKNDLGLEAVLTIKEDRRNGNRSGMDFDELVISSDKGTEVLLAEFLAEGYIEGYTAKERTGNPDILVRLQNKGKQVCWLAYWRDSNDEKAFLDYPLWQSNFDWDSQKILRQRQLLAPFFNAFKIKNQTPNPDA